MRGKRAMALKQEARDRGHDGSVIISHEYKRLKKSYNNPHYAAVVVLFPTKPGIKFTGKARLERKKKENKK